MKNKRTQILKDYLASTRYNTIKNSAIDPDHYKVGGIETIDFIEAKGLNYNLGNAVKYISRAGKKGGSSYQQDLEKANWYINREINRLTK